MPVDQPFIAPILACSKDILIKPHTGVFGLHLHPVYASRLFGTSPAGLRRNAHLMENILTHREYQRLKDAVFCAADFGGRIRRVLDFFDGYGRQRDFQKREAVNGLLEGMGKARLSTLKEIAADMGYSLRWIEKLHKEYTGIAPGEMQRILRFNKFIGKMYLHGNASAQLALDSGYYDQAHAIREFRKLAGITPGSFARQLPSLARMLNSC